jgi:hypothetical protein
MAHGSAAVLRSHADAAAGDAAAEARREAVDEQPINTKTSAPAPAKAGKTATARAEWKKFQIIGWITNFNSVEFGFYKKSRNKAKSRQFTSDMDIYAEVVENGERTGLLGYREDLWSKNVGMDKRLVFKLFSEGLNWRGTMDLMLARSVQQTLGARGLPVMTYALNTNDHEQVVYLERSAHKWPLMPENFSFFLLDEGRLEFYRVRRKVFALGVDYVVYDQRNDVGAHLDGKLLSLSSRWNCRVRGDFADKRLMTVLKMFGGMLIFNRQCRSHIRKVAAAVKAGRHNPKIERQEADLYMNPRRVR